MRRARLVLGLALFAYSSAELALLPVAALTRRVRPRTLLSAGMITLAVSQALLAVSPNLLVVEFARDLAAVFHGIVWASVPVAATALVPDRPGQATATVFLASTPSQVKAARGGERGPCGEESVTVADRNSAEGLPQCSKETLRQIDTGTDGPLLNARHGRGSNTRHHR